LEEGKKKHAQLSSEDMGEEGWFETGEVILHGGGGREKKTCSNARH